MKRPAIVKIHLILAGFFLPFLIIIPLSGGLYLAGEKGSFEETKDFVLKEKLPEQKDLFEKRVWEIFREQGISYQFEYARMRQDGADLRPTSKPHYRIRYKNHGPRAFKWLQIFFALGLLSIGISGVYLAFSVTTHRKPLFISAAFGFILFIILHNI